MGDDTAVRYRLRGMRLFGTAFVITDDTVEARGLLSSAAGVRRGVRSLPRSGVTGLVLATQSGIRGRIFLVPRVVATDGRELEILPLALTDTDAHRRRIDAGLAEIGAVLGLTGPIAVRNDL